MSLKVEKRNSNWDVILHRQSVQALQCVTNGQWYPMLSEPRVFRRPNAIPATWIGFGTELCFCNFEVRVDNRQPENCSFPVYRPLEIVKVGGVKVSYRLTQFAGELLRVHGSKDLSTRIAKQQFPAWRSAIEDRTGFDIDHLERAVAQIQVILTCDLR